MHSDQEKKKRERDFLSKLANFLPRPFLEGSSANISANVSRESTSISKIEPFDSWGFPHYYAVRFRTRFQISLLLLLLLLHPSCSTRLQSLLLRVFPRSNHVSFLPPTFPRPLPAVLSPAAVYAPCETKWERHPPLHLHRGISIYLLVFNSRLDIQRDVRHFETWIRNLNYAMPRSTIPRLEARLFRDSPKENFISSPIFSFFPVL